MADSLASSFWALRQVLFWCPFFCLVGLGCNFEIPLAIAFGAPRWELIVGPLGTMTPLLQISVHSSFLFPNTLHRQCQNPAKAATKKL